MPPLRAFVALAVLLVFSAGPLTANEKPLSALFLGDDRGHRPRERSQQLIPVLATRGIQITYTERLEDLNLPTLSKYDCLIIFANHEHVEKPQEKALLDYVAQGGGFVAIHCASFCFLNSPDYIALVGAQFQSHTDGRFRTRVTMPDHPIMKNLEGFETWDETYVHAKHNEDRTVLQVRRESDRDEPWTWVRTHGKGRIFYTAYGHDDHTWGNPGFHELIERGIRWTCGADGVLENRVVKPAGPTPFEYVEEKIAYYAPDQKTKGADPWSQMQLPLDAAESMRRMVAPRDFKIELFASEPDVINPIAMNWDEKGRLWIAETFDYPNELQPLWQGNDRIKICEDTDGDGRADKFTVFAEKLSIPTSLVFSQGGVIVAQQPDTVFLRDTDGDDRADERRVLFTGWRTKDTHSGANNLRWGFDNWIWGMVGYSGFDGTVGTTKHDFRHGFIRFRPDGSELEFLRATNNNSWGFGFSEEGYVFGSTANGNPSVYMPIPNRYYESVRGWSASRLESMAGSILFYPITEKVRQVDWHRAFSAGAGHAVYTARSFPKFYWNRTAFVTGPTGHLIGTFIIKPDGSDFVSHNSWNLLASDDEWTAPIIAEVGPDGAVWVVDWYNYIVQHNPTPFGFDNGKGNAYITHLRDKKHGRIYRIVHKDAQTPDSLKLDTASTEELVNALHNDNQLWRMHAQRLIVENNKKDAIPALIEMARDTTVDEIGLNPGVIHALATLDGLRAFESGPALVVANAALRHKSAGVRRMAIQVLPESDSTTNALLGNGLLKDPDAQVRLATLLKLAELPHSPSAAQAIALAITRPENALDRWIPDAATSAAATHDVSFLDHLADIVPTEHTEEALTELVRRVSEHYARGAPVETVAKIGQSLGGARPAILEAVIGGLSDGWPESPAPRIDEPLYRTLTDLLPKLSLTGKTRLIRLGTRWGDKRFESLVSRIADQLRTAVENRGKADEERVDAARQLIELVGNNSGPARGILEVIGAQTPPELATGLLEAVALSRSSEVGVAIVEKLEVWTPSIRQAALGLLLEQTEWTKALLSGAENGKIELTNLSLLERQRLLSHPETAIATQAQKLLKKTGGLPNADRQAVIEDLLAVTRRRGNVEAGKEHFQKHCSKCHVHKGEGAHFGPDLSGMAARSKEDLLVEILDPNRSVEGNYYSYVVATNDGQILTGLLGSETRTTVELYDVEGKKHVVLREDIAHLASSRKSVMPEGFERELGAEGLADLLEYLTDTGTYVPLPLDKVATTVSSLGMFHHHEHDGETLMFDDWSPKSFRGVPFHLVDPLDDSVPNVILLNSHRGKFPPKMPKSVSVPCGIAARAIHFLSGVGGWASQEPREEIPEKTSMIVRLEYADGQQEDHPLYNGLHFADYIGHFDVPKSEFAFGLARNNQIRYLAIRPKRAERLKQIDLIKGTDHTAPAVMAITVEVAK